MDNISPLGFLGQLMPMFGMMFAGEGGTGETDTSGEGEETRTDEGEGSKTGSEGGNTYTESEGEGAPPQRTEFSWKGKLQGDMKNSPTLKKFDDSVEGFNKFTESHLNLEKLLGHEKVPIPKGSEDTEGWSRFSKAMGIPTKPEGYSLEDAELPEELSGQTMSKDQFAEIMHANKLTPAQAANLWSVYNKTTSENFMDYKKNYETKINEVRNSLKREWGDAYEANVDLGKTVIDRFSDDNETADFITASMLQDPRGVKFLSKLGSQFAENKISGFQYKKFALSPQDAQKEIDEIASDPTHPYSNDRAPKKERDRAIDYVNNLYRIVNKIGQS